MTHRLCVSALLMSVLIMAAVGGSQAYTTTKLDNGLTVIIEEDHSVDLVGIDFWVKAGSGGETEKTNGVAHMVEHLLFGATSSRKSGQMDLEMETIGATLDAHTSRDWAHFSTTVASRDLPKALDVLYDAVTNAAFEKDAVERERPVIIEEISKKRSDPFPICRDYLAKALYGSHPYALPVEGTPESVKALTRDDIAAYYRARYIPANMAVIIVGDVDKQQALAQVARVFAKSPNTPPTPAAYPALTPPAAPITKTVKAPFKYTYLGFAFLGPRGDNYTDVCATDVLLTYLGMGYRSWMSVTLKEKMGLAQDVSADYLTQVEPGMISLIAATRPQNTQRAKAAIMQEIERVKKSGITEADLAMAKRSMLGQFAFDSETYAGRANALGFYFAVSEVGFNARYAAGVQAVTSADIAACAVKYLDLDHSVMLTLGADMGGVE